MVRTALVSVLLGLELVAAQSLAYPGTDNHPPLTTYTCTKRDGCKKQTSYIVIDSSQHHVYQKNAKDLDCGSWGSAPNTTACPDAKTCAKNCLIEPIKDYSQVGVKTSGSSLFLDMLKDSDLSSLSPRVYLLDGDRHKYDMIKLLGQEFTFDVDVSKLPCGMNGALYLSEMNKYGGKSYLNKVGAELGGGYCDAQCFTTPFIEGVGNIEGKGACCNEMDIWEANSRATGYTPHPCNHTGFYAANANESSFEGVCDKWGCGFNAYANGVPSKYGRGHGFDIDTTRVFTVVTSFPVVNGELDRIERKYVQDGKIIGNAFVNITGRAKKDYIDDAYCEETPGGTRRFTDLGGTAVIGEALGRGMVLAMSIWWDVGGNMNWLDSTDSGTGPCNSTEGSTAVIEKIQPDTSVTFSNIKWGEIGSTYKGK